MKRKIVIIPLLFFIMPTKMGSAQIVEAARSYAFDRGLIDVSEPFAPAGNPALLAGRSYFRLNGELYRTDDNFFMLSTSSPLSPGVGIGLAWYGISRESFQHKLSGTQVRKYNRQAFLLGLGHWNPFHFGQQFEISWTSDQTSPLQPQEDVFNTDQNFALVYRLGLFKEFSEKLSVGFLTAPIFRFRYRTVIIDSVRSSGFESDWMEEETTGTHLPMIAVKWQPTPSLAFVLSNRSKQGKIDMQLAADIDLPFNLDITTALKFDGERKKRDFIFGLGGYIKGLDMFAAYGIQRRDFLLAMSFAPEHSKELVDVLNIENSDSVLYPYRVAHNYPNWLARVELKNKTDKPVEVSVKLSGNGLPSTIRSSNIEGNERSFIEIPMPRSLYKAAPGIHYYNVEVVAFQRGRHELKRQFSFEMKDVHDWAGHSNDLNYFIQQDHKEILKTARTLFANLRKNEHNIHSPMEIAKQFYDFLSQSFQYVHDPRPLGARQDRVQYAIETLDLESGDCEDLSILMVSLLESVGIRAAFVEVVPPNSEEGHILLMFDSQKNMSEVFAENENLQRYIIRKNQFGVSNLFIPLELTRLDLDFEEAWLHALTLYQKFGIDKGGLAEGWVKIIDSSGYINNIK